MACKSIQLSAITTSCGSNIPSIKKLWVGKFEGFTFTYDYVQIEDPENPGSYIDYTDEDGNKVIVDIKTAALATGADKMVEFGFRKNTCSASSEMTVNDNGSYYWTNNVNMIFAKQDVNKRLSIQAVASGECTIMYEDGNGNYWVMGVNDPVSMTSGSATTGTSVSDTNQYELTLSETSGILPIPVLATAVETVKTAIVESNA